MTRMAGMFENRVVLEVQQANDIVDVIGEHVSLKKKGREMVGLCPFHADHRPSMNVSNVKQICKCFACGAGGDVFKFVQMRENLTFPQAIERLAEHPFSGKKVEELPDSPYREVVVAPCRIFYRLDKNTVYILHVMRGERLLRDFLLEERNNERKNFQQEDQADSDTASQ